MSKPTDIRSRVLGSILGVAVADALGGPVEFLMRGSFPKVDCFIPNEHFRLPPGTWTDDTSMTLCLAQSLIDTKGIFVPQSAIRKYCNWFNTGYLSATGYCFDIGRATRIALAIWNQYFSQSHSNNDESDPDAHEPGQVLINQALKREAFCGNGSLMRVSSIGLVYYKNISLATSCAIVSSEATHPYPTNAEACIVYTRLIALTINNASKETLASDLVVTSQAWPSLKDRFGMYTSLQAWFDKQERDISSSGYVIDTLEAALWSFFTTESFEEGAIKVVNLGDDADTVGAVYGGLAGAYYGDNSIPKEWRNGLQRRNVVEGIALGLADLVDRQ